MMATVTVHAAERYIERVNGSLSIDQAESVIMRSARAIDAAAAFGCRVVRLGCGAKLILVGDRVVTVIEHRRRGGHGERAVA